MNARLPLALLFVAAPAAADEAPPAGPALRAASESSPAEPSRPAAPGESRLNASRFAGGFTTAPVRVIDHEDIVRSGKTSIGAFLQTLPIQANALNAGVDNGGDGSTRVALRGLGDARTLILLNGRRLVPGGTGAGTAVDLESIPSAAIDHIEILVSGGSAVHGSEAIGGVVNLVTRAGFTGAELAAQTGVSSRGDGRSYDLSARMGVRGQRGGLFAAAGFDRSEAVMGHARDWTGAWSYDQVDGPRQNPSTTMPSPRIVLSSWDRGQPVEGASDTYLALMAACSSLDRRRCPASYVRAPGTALGWAPFPSPDTAGGYDFTSASYLIPPQQRVQLFASADQRLGDTARLYLESAYTNRHSQQQLAPLALATENLRIVIAKDNLYNPFAVDVTGLRRRMVEMGDRRTTQDASTVRVVTGVDGTLPAGVGPVAALGWDVSLAYGRNAGTEVTQGQLVVEHLREAVGPSYVDASGPHCGTPETPVPGCVPVDLFEGPGSLSPAMVNYLGFTGVRRTADTQLVARATASGDLRHGLGSRPATVGVGYELRQVGGASVIDPVTSSGGSSQGLVKSVSGSYGVQEGWADLAVPLTSERWLAHDLVVHAASRLFAHASSGVQSAWELGTRWVVVPAFTVRGTWSTAYRAPSVGELYGPPFDTYPSVRDLCSGFPDPPSPHCGAAALNGDDQTMLHTIVGGNPDLRPERARVATAGVVVEPLDGLSLAVDYWDLDVTGTITSLGASTILTSCYPADAATAPRYCDRIVRDPVTTRITTILDLQSNAGSERTAGIDAGLRYSLPTALGRLGATLDVTWLRLHDRTLPDGTVIHGKGNFDLSAEGIGGVNPAWRFDAGLSWSFAGVTASARLRYVGSIRECGQAYSYDGNTWSADYAGAGRCWAEQRRVQGGELPAVLSREVGAYELVDVAASWDVSRPIGGTRLLVGVNNALDAAPRRIYNGFSNGTDIVSYDAMGRWFYVRLEQAL